MIETHPFDSLVQEALAHLYDVAYLESGVLARRLSGDRRRMSGAELHRLLVDTIERLKPPRDVATEATAWKTYRSLFLRYVRSLSAAGVASELGLSPRQAQRVHGQALRAVSALLQAREAGDRATDSSLEAARSVGGIWDVAPSAGREIDDDLAPILAGDWEVVETLAVTLRSAVETLTPILDRRDVKIDVSVDDTLDQRGVSRIVARQAVVALGLAILDGARPDRIRVSATPDPFGARVVLSAYRDGGRDLVARSEAALGQRLLVARRLLSAVGGDVVVDFFEEDVVPGGAILEIEVRLPLQRQRAVLVVEDNPQVVQLFRRYLSGSMFRVLTALDADSALDLARASQPDLLTLDVMMPRRDGWELLQALKVHPETRDIPVVICSVLRERELALALGAAEFIAKPVTRRALLDALNRIAITSSGRAGGTPSSG